MESSESPLDVLSRAATMVQDNVLPPSYDEARSYAKCKEVPLASVSVSGGKWRRERRPRAPPDYPGEPLDMSTRRPRGSPPSYSQSLSHIRRTQATPAPTQSPVTAEELGGVCDPVIDEHFRRSLGKDYSSIFTEDGQPRGNGAIAARSLPAVPATPPSPSSLSVDDHFAKALGETWLKLQRGENASELRHRADSAAVTI